MPIIKCKGDVKAQQQRYKLRVKDEKRFSCVYCDKCFSNSPYLKLHNDKKKHIFNFIHY